MSRERAPTLSKPLGVREMPVGLEAQPVVGRQAEDLLEPERGVLPDTALLVDQLSEPGMGGGTQRELRPLPWQRPCRRIGIRRSIRTTSVR